MGVSTDGQICYGIMFDEYFGFPWVDDDGCTDIDEWWRKVNGFKHSVEIYDKDGYRLEGVTKAVEDKYYQEKKDWDKENPIPFETVNYQSGEYPAYILAIPGLTKRAYRGCPESFEPTDLVVDNKDVTKLILFVTKYLDGALASFEQDHGKPIDLRPKWWLSSYWG